MPWSPERELTVAPLDPKVSSVLHPDSRFDHEQPRSMDWPPPVSGAMLQRHGQPGGRSTLNIGATAQRAHDITFEGGGRSKHGFIDDESEGMAHRPVVHSVPRSAVAAVWKPFDRTSATTDKPAGKNQREIHRVCQGSKPPPPARAAPSGAELRVHHLDGKPYDAVPRNDSARGEAFKYRGETPSW
eukprot:4233874-Prymnesium_polylepis.1